MEKSKSKTKKRSKRKTSLKPNLSKVQQIDIICNDPFTKCLSYIGHLHGLKKIILSPNAQEFVGCRIGIEITSVTPWIFVEADRIRESIELYQNTSDFCSIKPFMERYRDPEVLLGCYSAGSADQEQEFYICTNRRAKEEVIKLLRKERNDIMKNVYNTFSYDALFWQTANENDIVKKRHHPNRHSLYEVEINLPIAPAKRKLSTRTVQEAIDGYTEFPPKHEKYKNIMRRRIDSYVQPNTKKSKQINTNKSLAKNMFTQYKQELDSVQKIYGSLKPRRETNQPKK